MFVLRCIFLRSVYQPTNAALNKIQFMTSMKFLLVSILDCYLRVSWAPYTLSVKLSDFTVWRHTWRKTEQTAQFWQAIAQASELSFPVVFRTENYTLHSGNPTVSSVYLPTSRWNHLKAHPFLAIHSAHEHRMIYSFSNTTSYSTFYAFFSSFRITLWPMWLANSKRQPCFYLP